MRMSHRNTFPALAVTIAGLLGALASVRFAITFASAATATEELHAGWRAPLPPGNSD